MIQIGYKLSSEEFGPNELVRQAQAAEDKGFSFALISDHFHPWIDAQGESPFVWSVLGAIAVKTRKLEVGTGVTAPVMRIHPAIIAQAAATSARLMPRRFFLGVGTGENLNEQIVGQHWSADTETRQERLMEAIEIIKLLLSGGLINFKGKYFTVENARIYTLPDYPVPLYVAIAGPKSAGLAARFGDGIIGTSPNKDAIEIFDAGGGGGKPKYGELGVCYDDDEMRAARLAAEVWPLSGFPNEIQAHLPLPSHFDAVTKLITPEMMAHSIPCGPDPEKYIRAIQAYANAGYTHVCLHQIGPRQYDFMDFYEREIMPKVT
jgi:coenzyme F420-dependent glucose-6-phosphate dehydrogenase